MKTSDSGTITFALAFSGFGLFLTPSGLAIAPSHAAIRPDLQTLVLQDLRWLPARGAIVPLSQGFGQVLEFDNRGELVAEFDFHSDHVELDGTHTWRAMDVIWRIADAAGDWISVRGLDPGEEWNGIEYPVPVAIDSISELTGASRATLRIPVGGNVPSDLGTRGRYPTLPDIAASVEIAVGWRGVLTLGANANVQGALLIGQLQLQTRYPEVRIGSASPAGAPAIHDEGYPFFLCLRTPSTEDRTFSITAQPPGIVVVLDPMVTIPAGEVYAQVRIRGDELGDFRLLVEEGGWIVAQSDVESVVQRTRIVSDGYPEGLYHTSSGILAFDGGLFDWLLGNKRCVPGREPGGPDEPTIEICFPCKGDPNPQPSCEAEGGGSTSLLKDAECTGKTGQCHRAFTPANAYAYVWTGKTDRPCLSTKAGFQVSFFGIVRGGVEVTHTQSAWCCTYKHDPNVPAKTVPLLVCSGGGV